MPPTTRKAPQDRKPKAVKPTGYTFEHDVVDPKTGVAETVTFSLPPATQARAILPGHYVRDAVMGGADAELRLIFASLESVGIPQETLDALYAKPSDEMLTIAQGWFAAKDDDGVSAPQS